MFFSKDNDLHDFNENSYGTKDFFGVTKMRFNHDKNKESCADFSLRGFRRPRMVLRGSSGE